MGLFDNIQVGDEVVKECHYNTTIEKVTKVTPRRFVVLGSYYDKERGRKVTSDRWSFSRCIPLTEELRKKITYQNNLRYMRDTLHKVNLFNLSDEQTIKVYNYLKELSIIK